jgi:hypothetical protein
MIGRTAKQGSTKKKKRLHRKGDWRLVAHMPPAS